MTIANTLKLKFSLNGDLTEGTTADLEDLAAHGRITRNVTFTQGTAAAQVINRQVFGDATIAPAGGVSIDLNGGGLTTPAGETANFTKVRLLAVVLTSGTGPVAAGGATNTFNFGMGAATSTFSFQNLPFIAGRDDSVGLAVTGGSADLFVLTNNGADTVTLKYTVAGEG